MSVNEILPVRVFADGEDLCQVVAAYIDKADASKKLLLLSEQLPLQQFGLQHLKRIRKIKNEDNSCQLQVIFCTETYFENVSTEIKAQFRGFCNVIVPKYGPLCTDGKTYRTMLTNVVVIGMFFLYFIVEFKRWGTKWPLIFHPN